MIFKRKKELRNKLLNDFGKLKNRNAIKILQINNYPKDIINEALEISNFLDSASKINNPYSYEK